METLADFIEETARRFGPRPALLHKPDKTTQVWTYNELLSRANRVALWLREQGVEKGDRVILWAPNSPSWVAAYLGALRIGAIVVPLDVRSGADFAQRIIAQTNPKLAFLSKSTKDSWDTSSPSPTQIVEDLDALPETSTEAKDETLRPDDIAALMFTSGTTGDPKGVIITHGNILANVEATDLVVPNIK